MISSSIVIDRCRESSFSRRRWMRSSSQYRSCLRPEILRDLSQQLCHLTQVFALLFASTGSPVLDSNYANIMRELLLIADRFATPNSSAYITFRTAPISTNYRIVPNLQYVRPTFEHPTLASCSLILE